MSLTTCPDCGHPAPLHATGQCRRMLFTPDVDWGPCGCRRGSVAVFLPDNLDSMALRYAAARLEMEYPSTTAATIVARYLRGLAR